MRCSFPIKVLMMLIFQLHLIYLYVFTTLYCFAQTSFAFSSWNPLIFTIIFMNLFLAHFIPVSFMSRLSMIFRPIINSWRYFQALARKRKYLRAICSLQIFSHASSTAGIFFKHRLRGIDHSSATSNSKLLGHYMSSSDIFTCL